jgi:hypothetical protein
LSVAGYRPGTEIKIAILPGRDGTLKALSLTAYSGRGKDSRQILTQAFGLDDCLSI